MMKTSAAVPVVALLLLAGGVVERAGGQKPAKGGAEDVPPLFRQETPLAVTLTADLRRLRSDKDTNAAWRRGTIAYASDSGQVVLPIGVRTRGLWRLRKCQFPPLRLDFPGKGTKNTVFHQLGKPKLVNYCRDTDSYEQLILQEHQLYRIYQLLTPVSYRVRLLRVAYVDSASGKTEATRYAILAEDPDHLAKRLNGMVVKTKGATAGDFVPEALALAFVFQYMIGNTDFSFNGLHNTNVIGTSDGSILPVAYDFDFAGAVNATYATPDPSLNLRSVRQRRFRGYCAIAGAYPGVLPLFRDRKAAIYALYRDEVGRLLDEGRVRETLSYFDEFFEAIGTPESAHRAFLKDCLGPH